MREIVFVDAARTAFGNIGGGFKSLAATDLGAHAIKGLLMKSGILERNGVVDGVFLGCAFPDAKSINPARYATIGAGLPISTESHFVEMQCGSAITSINHAAAMIGAGAADVLIVGGCESYSAFPVKIPMDNEPYKLIEPRPIDLRQAPDEEENINMIQVSEKMAKKWGISRAQCDDFAARSQEEMQNAYKRGITGAEIIPYVFSATKKSPELVIDKDEFPRPETTAESLSKLRSVYPDGVTTAGNASGRNDGAAFVLMMSAEKAKELGYTPYARWVAGADIGCSPSLMGIGPAYSNLKAMKLAGIALQDVDVFECNEAFAAQNLSVIREMEVQAGAAIDFAKWNPNGGAIAIGHPNAASGARIAWFAMSQLEQTGGRYGVFGSCCGGGHGTSTVIENLRK